MSYKDRSDQLEKKRKNSPETPPFPLDANNDERQQREDFFARLPNEVIVKILTYLDFSDVATKCSMLNSRFHDLCQHPSLWKKCKLPSELKMSMEEALLLLQRCTRLRELGVQNRWDGYAIANYALEHCSALQALHLRCITPSTLTAIEEHGRSLRKLSSVNDGILRDDFLQETPGCLAHLTTINLGDTPVTFKTLKILVDHCENLDDFTFNASGMTKDVMTRFFKAVKTSIRQLTIKKPPLQSLRSIGICTLLQVLKVDKHHSPWSFGELKSISGLQRLSFLRIDSTEGLNREDFIQAFRRKKLVNLRQLEILFGDDAVDDEVLEVVAKNCADLIHLMLSYCTEVTGSGIKRVLEGCRQLTSLHLRLLPGLTDESLADLPTAGMKLKQLRVVDCPKITKKVLLEVQKVFENAAKS